MARVGYDSIDEALAAIKVSYVLELQTHETGNYYNVKVSAPLHKNSEYYLPNSYSVTNSGTHEHILKTLALRYGIGRDTFYFVT